MAVPFDHIASSYDALFSRSMIGQLQRKLVWNYVLKVLPELDGLEMLELNCGTGEDALLFSDRGFNIVATDVSAEMLRVTQQKVQQYSMQHRISSQYLDLESFDATVFNKKFDLVFSNFGGLNCVNPDSLKQLFDKIPDILAPGGRFIAVVMPRACLWESAYFLSKMRLRQVFRRATSKPVLADLGDAQFKIWYYSPRQIRKWGKPHFKVNHLMPIGFSLPPSYLEKFFARRKRWLLALNRWEKRLGSIRPLAQFSDHYLIDLQLK